MNWDEYFLEICNVISQKSKCLSRHLGAVLTRDNIIVSTGYNSPPRGIPSCSERYYVDKNLQNELSKIGITKFDKYINICPRRALNFKSGFGLEWCPTIHAEKNCLLAAARNGTSTKGTIMYLNAKISPCSQCFGAMINAGVKEVVLLKNIMYDKTVEFLIENSNLKIREFDIK